MIKSFPFILYLFLFHAASSYAADSVVSPDYLPSLKQQAEQGDAAAQFNLAVLYHNGQGVPLDYKQSAEWLRKAAYQGNADAELNLAMLYHNGQGVPLDYKQAAMWCQRSADQGNSNAQIFLSQLYKKGEGVPQDDKMSIGWLIRGIRNSGQAHLVSSSLRSAPPLADNKIPPLKPISVILLLAAILAIMGRRLIFNFFKRKR